MKRLNNREQSEMGKKGLETSHLEKKTDITQEMKENRHTLDKGRMYRFNFRGYRKKKNSKRKKAAIEEIEGWERYSGPGSKWLYETKGTCHGGKD